MTTLALAMLFAKDMQRMSAFYRDGLGLTPRAGESEPDWAVFDAGGTRFALHAIPPQVAASIKISDPPQRRSDTPIKLTFTTPDLEGASARAERFGGRVVAKRDGEHELLDPEGNVLQLVRTP